MKYHTRRVESEEASRIILLHLIANKVSFVWEPDYHHYEVTVAIEDKSHLNVAVAKTSKRPKRTSLADAINRLCKSL